MKRYELVPISGQHVPRRLLKDQEVIHYHRTEPGPTAPLGCSGPCVRHHAGQKEMDYKNLEMQLATRISKLLTRINFSRDSQSMSHLATKRMLSQAFSEILVKQNYMFSSIYAGKVRCAGAAAQAERIRSFHNPASDKRQERISWGVGAFARAIGRGIVRTFVTCTS